MIRKERKRGLGFLAFRTSDHDVTIHLYHKRVDFMFGQGSPKKRRELSFFSTEKETAPAFRRRMKRVTAMTAFLAGVVMVTVAPLTSASSPKLVSDRSSKSTTTAAASSFAPAGSLTDASLSASTPPSSTTTVSSAAAKEEAYPLRLNISWNSAAPMTWNGEIRIDHGFFWNIVPLGNDPAASVMFRLGENKGTIPFSTASPMSSCGVQVTVVAPLSSSLTLTLRGGNGLSEISRTFTQEEFLKGAVQVPFDADDHGLVIQRAPGDAIPLTVTRLRDDGKTSGEAVPSMVFDEGETLVVGIFTKFLPPASGGSRRLLLTMKPSGRDETLWSDSIEISDRLLSGRPRFDIPVPIRNVDGAFDVVIELTQTVPGGKNRFPIPQNPFSGSGKDSAKGTVLARRVIQGVAVASGKPVFDTEETVTDIRETLLETIDPTNPAWWKIFARRSSSSDETPKSAPKTAASEKNSWPTDFLKKWQWGELQSQIKPLTMTGNWGRWDSLWQHSLGSGHLEPLGSADPRDAAFVRLNPSGNPADPAWESYTVPIKEPGKPHLLEIEYLPDYPQKLGVSVLEPSFSGGIFPRTLDNGLLVGESPLSDQISHRVLRYQVLFWPKTRTPIILLMNRDSEHPAIYGRIRIYRAKDHFSSATASHDSSRRSFTAVMSRPTFCEQFHAENAPAYVGVLGAQDWRTFDQGASRMTDYLQSVGCDSLLLSVMADGSALYPSDLLKPNPRFDSGVFLTEGNDPVRKDVAEFLFRRFQKENLTLIPLLSFNAPLPMLEEEFRRGNPTAVENSSNHLVNEENSGADGIYLIGPKGERLTVSNGENAEYALYNLLNPTVQREIFRVLDEFADRYARHESFGGVAVDLSAMSFARLPENVYYGLDDETIRRFVQEMELAARCPENLKKGLEDFVLARDTDRYYRRAVMIRDHFRNDWIRWRAVTVTRFYRRAARILTSRRPEARLYLTGLGPDSRADHFSPFASDPFYAACCKRELLLGGFDLNLLHQDGGIVFLRSSAVADESSSVGDVSFGIRENPASIGLFTRDGASDGVLFYHDTSPINLASFDRVSPFHPTVTQVETRFTPSDFQNRRRLARQLAVCDTRVMMDGGEMIPMGEEDSLREWIAAYRSLPTDPFVTYVPERGTGDVQNENDGQSLDPVVFRYLKKDGEFWGYLVNNAPFHCGVSLSMKFAGGAETVLFTGMREMAEPEEKNDGFRWSCSLKPYDLVAFKIADPGARVDRIEISPPKEICGKGGRLEKEIGDYLDRLLIASEGLELPLRNSDFEEDENDPEPVFSATSSVEPPHGDKESKPILGLDIPKMNLLRNPFASEKKENTPKENALSATNADVPVNAETEAILPGWQRFGDHRFQITLDRTHFKEGTSSLKLSNIGSVGGILSQPFPAPRTGRLFANITFGLSADLPELPLRISLSGRSDGVPWQRPLSVGPILRQRATDAVATGNLTAENGIVWIRDSVLFDELPTGDLTDLSIRFDLLAEGTVWIDDIHLYKFAFDREEQAKMIETVKSVEEDLARGRVTRLLDRLSSPLAGMLSEELPPDSPLMAQRPSRPDFGANSAGDGEGGENGSVTKTSATESPNGEEEKPKEAKSFLRRILPW